jgi:hypothetical protein
MSNQPDKVNNGALASILVITALATFGVALVVTALVREETARLRSEGDAAQERSFRQLRAEQETKLNASAGWVDKEAGLAKVPVGSAQQIVLEAMRDNPLALSPWTPVEDEEDEEESEEGADGEEEADEETDGEEEEASDEEADKPEAKEAAPAPKVAPAPKAAPAPAAPAPKAPAPAAPAPKAPAPAAPAPAPAPGGPAQ